MDYSDINDIKQVRVQVHVFIAALPPCACVVRDISWPLVHRTIGN